MANQNCMGSWFRVGHERFYTCMWDASLVRGDDCPVQGGPCPNCNRTVDGTNCGQPPVITRILRQVQFPNGRAVTFSAQTIHGDGDPTGGFDMDVAERMTAGIDEVNEQLILQRELFRDLSAEVVALRKACEKKIASCQAIGAIHSHA